MAGNLPLTSIRGAGGVSSVSSYPFANGYSSPAAAKKLSRNFAPNVAQDYFNGRSSMFLVPRRGGGGGGRGGVSHVNHISGTGKLHLDYNEKQRIYWDKLRSLMSSGLSRVQAHEAATAAAGQAASSFYANRLNAAISSPIASQNPLAASHLTRQTPAAGGIFDLWKGIGNGWGRNDSSAPAANHRAESTTSSLLYSPDDGANGGGAFASIAGSSSNQAFHDNPYSPRPSDMPAPQQSAVSKPPAPPLTPTLKEEESTRGTYQ